MIYYVLTMRWRGGDCRWPLECRISAPLGQVFGKVVDADTGKPVEAFITQAGKFDPKDPKKVPGRYQFARSRSLRHGNIGQGMFLDRQFVDTASDKTTLVSFERPTGTRLKGGVEWDEGTKLTGVILAGWKPTPRAIRRRLRRSRGRTCVCRRTPDATIDRRLSRTAAGAPAP